MHLIIFLFSEILQGSLRFAVKSSPHFLSGRLEVYINGTWGTVCADGWGINETSVACRQMGLQQSRGTHRVWPANEHSIQPIWLAKVECLGGESQLTDCKHSKVHDCDHSEDVGIVCANLSLGELHKQMNVIVIVNIIKNNIL